MICSWHAFLASNGEAVRDAAEPRAGNDNRASRDDREERHFVVALSLARTLLVTRAQFARALRDAALARAERERADAFFLHTVEQNVDDALYAIGRDGAETLADNVRRAIADIVREASTPREMT